MAQSGAHVRPNDGSRARFAAHLADLVDRFDGEPLPASFRQMVGPLAADENVHQLHPYPARLTRHIPRLILSSQLFGTKGDIVLDPFVGSGTVAVEAQTAGFEPWGIDSNPLAALITSVKTQRIDYAALETAIAQHRVKSLGQSGQIAEGLSYWFSSAAGSAISALREQIVNYSDHTISDFFKLTLSRTVHELAHRDPRIPVPVRPRNSEIPRLTGKDVLDRHSRIADAAFNRLRSRSPGLEESQVRRGDARHVSHVFTDLLRRGQRPDIVITSPPYGAAQKYLRSSSLSLYALGEATPADMPRLDSSTIGREKLRGIAEFNASRFSSPLTLDLAKIADRNLTRAEIYSVYFHEMGEALHSAVDALRLGGHFVLIASDNTVAGLTIHTHRHLADMLESNGLVPRTCIADRIHARSFSTKRHSSASEPISTEFVHIFQKVV
jgi:hypothetical protein